MNFYQFPPHALSEIRMHNAIKTYIPEKHELVEDPKCADIIIMSSAMVSIPEYYGLIDRPIVYGFESGNIEQSIDNIKKAYRDCDLIFTYSLDLLEKLQSVVDIFYLAPGVSDEFYLIDEIEKKYEVFFPSPHDWNGFYSYYQELNKRKKNTCYPTNDPDSIPFNRRELLRDNIGFEFAWPLKEDEKLNKIYNSSRFIMDYHPTGSNLGGLEGLMSGAIPINCDNKNTRFIFGNTGAYFSTIEEFISIIDSDLQWNKQGADEVKNRLAWRVVMKLFWDKIVEKYG